MNPQLTIVGDGSFGPFLREMLSDSFDIVDDAFSVILAVPISAYADCAVKYNGRHLINVCSVQEPSTDVLRKHCFDPIARCCHMTALHPLFGARTPADKRHVIITSRCGTAEEKMFLAGFLKKCTTVHEMTASEHDRIMAKTHLAAVMAAQQMKIYVDRAKDIPDDLIPNSFRLLKNFVKTLDDMPPGTIESILANPY